MIPLVALRWLAHRRWIHFGLRDRILRSLAAPEKMSGHGFVTDFYGWRYTGDLGSFVDWTIYFYGAYELGILNLLARAAEQAGPGVVFLDIGANVGQHSLFMSRHVDQVHAFEPWPSAIVRLRSLLADNGVANIHVHELALGDTECPLPFYAPASANLGTGSFCPNVNENTAVGRLPVRVADSVIKELGLARVDLIKIDTEGFEVRILSGLKDTLARHGPVVVVEFALSQHENLNIPTLFPEGWSILTVGSHPERADLFAFDPAGQNMVTVIAGPSDKIKRLLCCGG
ncbi:FkbM family methyltransferase [Magnetospirillum gryphiswaldense]|uniref:Methyltransferase FkbM n=1 Tax=Magnetospirillum gryphiswaldense TaxID=55518 RepID=A4U1A0_9PROT|nr:FkbM family methyltransferase [Magnetospirillum gryphiswaldense]AVM75562.1 hypothetical protein MSR1_30960 [Magnetospirillum gryphiswaldense MSR-1]AVM79465.1 hypothetical protein MSR1L_30960 [Magnetospirillum gryphiswaldense]CAM76657.1 Methyltransferase FkbM [Magnetospirillum gryphiswaldense MSR-1]